MATNRPQCAGCKRYVDSLLEQIHELKEENENKRQHIDKLKDKNKAEKKRHTDINNEIIMSNVRYQQALNQAQHVLQRYVRDREEFLRKEAHMASLQAEVEALKTTNSQLLQRLDSKLEEAHEKRAKSPKPPKVPQVFEAKKPKKESATPPPQSEKGGLRIRTASEANSMTFPKTPAKRTNPSDKEKKPNRIVPPTDADAKDNITTHPKPIDPKITNKENTSNKRNQDLELRIPTSPNSSTDADESSDGETTRRHSHRLRDATKVYAEPSLRTKLRRGDSHPFIIPEYVGNPPPHSW